MENTARGVLRALPPPRALPFPLSLTLTPLARRDHRRAGDEAGREARAPRALSGAVRDPRAVRALRRRRARRRRPAIRRRCRRCCATPTAANLIRVFTLQERLKALGKEGDFKASHVHVVGAGTMGGDIAAWCALRGLTVTLQDQDARAPRAGDEARARKLFAERLKDPRRVARCARPADPRRRRRRRRARRRHHRGDLRERRRQARAVRGAREASAQPDAILATNTSSIPLEEIAGGAAPIRRASSACTSSIRWRR